jgi:hypothetical protein
MYVDILPFQRTGKWLTVLYALGKIQIQVAVHAAIAISGEGFGKYYPISLK